MILSSSSTTGNMGGAWERMIGLTRRILDTMLMDKAVKVLTNEVHNKYKASCLCVVGYTFCERIGRTLITRMLLFETSALRGIFVKIPQI